jgi:nucleotide-binding universal stress UspA family protein
MERIVVPAHPGQRSTAAADLAAAIARHEGSEVHIVIVCQDAQRTAAESLIAEMTTGTFAGVAAHQAVIRGTDVDAELVRYCRRVDADALFLNAGARQISTLKQDIIRQVDSAVMLVP